MTDCTAAFSAHSAEKNDRRHGQKERKRAVYEKSFDYENLINAAIENEEVIKISNKKKDFDI